MTSRKLNITTIRYPERRNVVLLFLLQVLGDSLSCMQNLFCQSNEDLRNFGVATCSSIPEGIQSIWWFLPQEQQPSAERQGQPWSCFLQHTRVERFSSQQVLTLAISNTAPLMQPPLPHLSMSSTKINVFVPQQQFCNWQPKADAKQKEAQPKCSTKNLAPPKVTNTYFAFFYHQHLKRLTNKGKHHVLHVAKREIRSTRTLYRGVWPCSSKCHPRLIELHITV